MNPPNIAALVEAKDGTGLVEGDVLRQANDIPVEGAANVVELRALVSLRDIESECFALTSEKMNVLAGSKPMAMMSLALLLQYP